jgi:tetratricopeptide (TPR) repeat protein
MNSVSRFAGKLHRAASLLPPEAVSRLSRSRRRVAGWLVCAAMAVACLDAAAQQSPAEQYNAAMAAFLAKNYPAAVTGLNALIAQFKDASPEVKKTLAPAQYTLGAAYFNSKDYDNAIKAFSDYKKQFPDGEHIASVIFSLANAYYTQKKYDEAIVELKLLEHGSQMEGQALYLHGFILNEQKKFAEAAVPLEAIIANGLNTSKDIDAALLLASVYTKLQQYDKAGQLLTNIKKNFQLVANKVRFNTLIIDLGDKLFADGLSRQAIDVYRVAQTRSELIAAQEATIADLKNRDEEQLEMFRKTQDVKYVDASAAIRAQIVDAEAALKKIEGIKDFEPNLMLRLGRSYYECDRPWESLIVYDQLLANFPDAKERPITTFGRILALKDVKKYKEALDASNEYLKTYPQGAQRSVVIYLRGLMAVENQDYPLAVEYLTKGIAEDPQSEYVPPMAFLIAEAKFTPGTDYPGAIAAYQKYITDYPDGNNVEDCHYRIAMAAMLGGDYENGLKYVDNYLTLYPKGSYESDMRYRAALAKFGLQRSTEALADCEAWLKTHPGDAQTGQVLTLEGDIYAADGATKDPTKAAEKYAEAVKVSAAANDDDTLSYALGEVGKIYQQQRDWQKSIDLFEAFIKANPKNPAVVSCAYYLARARAKLGQTEEAKKFLTDTILAQANNPDNGSVERLITQLAQLTAKKPLPTPPPTPTPPPLPPEATPLPTPSPEEILAQQEADNKFRAAASEQITRETREELNNRLKLPKGTDAQSIYNARRLYAESELMRARRKNDEASDLIGQIGTKFRAQDLSAPLLGLAGDWLLVSGDSKKAYEMFDYLAGHYADSEFADFGYVGLGEIAYANGDFKTAYRNFKSAKDDVIPGQKLKEAYLGEAKSLLALDKLDESDKQYRYVVGNKQWKGEATAQSYIGLGDIEMKRRKYAEAIAYYQRVYIAYQKFPKYVAKAYLNSEEAFLQLGKKQEAINTLQEMLRNEKLRDIQAPELGEAQKRLTELQNGN